MILGTSNNARNGRVCCYFQIHLATWPDMCRCNSSCTFWSCS